MCHAAQSDRADQAALRPRKHAQDALGFSRAQRNQTDLWIIAQTAEYGLHLISHDRRMVRIAAAIGVPVVSLLPNIEQLLEADARRLSEIERGPLRD